MEYRIWKEIGILMGILLLWVLANFELYIGENIFINRAF